jgi:hypothetical protein
MVMKTHDRLVRSFPSAQGAVASTISWRQGHLRILTTPRDVKSNLANLVAAPKRRSVLFLLKCGVRSTITPFQNTHRRFYAPACATPPTSICVLFYELSSTQPPIDWTEPFFFPSFLFTNIQFDHFAGRDIHLYPPLLRP